jgi:hypothetical protein
MLKFTPKVTTPGVAKETAIKLLLFKNQPEIRSKNSKKLTDKVQKT